MHILSESSVSVNSTVGGCLPLSRQGEGLVAPDGPPDTITPDFSGYRDWLLKMPENERYIDAENVFESPLGKDSEIVQPPPPVSNEIKDLRKEGNRWGLLGAVKVIGGNAPAWKRLSHCHATMISGSVSVNRHIETGHMHFGNLATCGSVWACPVCAPKITERRRTELIEALKAADDLGLRPYMLTLTAPHNKGDRLEDCVNLVSSARRTMRNRKGWKRLSIQSGIMGSIRSLEVTWGNNGWHVHTHEILFLKKEAMPMDEEKVLSLWQSACVSVGLQMPNEHGVDIAVGNLKVGEYVSKWGLESEMTKSMIKRGSNESSTPWDILGAFAVTGDEDYADLFREYANCFRGRHQLEWSKGLRDRLGLGVEKSDEEIAAERIENCEVVCFIGRSDWKHILRHELRAQVLEAATLGGHEGVLAFVQGMHGDTT